MKKLVLGVAMVACLTVPALAQEAPPPHKAPRVPVNRETLVDRHAAQNRSLDGQALVIDGERLRIGNTEFRLFGVVPPQLSASFGPQARGALDALIGGQAVSCHIRDRSHDGHLLASCRTASGGDLGLELLRRGLAVTARGSIAETELAEPYMAAEQAAQNQRLGLWSVVAAAPAAEAAKPVAEAAVAKKDDAKKDEAAKADKNDKGDKADKEKGAKAAALVPALTTAALAAEPSAMAVPAAAGSAGSGVADFFARFQILIAGLLMLVTALGILGAMAWQRRVDQRDELKALAAALRGELMAARAVCSTRLKAIVTEEDDQTTVWPRLRATLYQAYVNKLGWLGAELARQVASIYGQSSDYAAYYGAPHDEANPPATPKRQALQTLIAHIEEVLPRLGHIEATGQRTASAASRSASASASVALPQGPVKRRITALASEPVRGAQALPTAAEAVQAETAAAEPVLHERAVQSSSATVHEQAVQKVQALGKLIAGDAAATGAAALTEADTDMDTHAAQAADFSTTDVAAGSVEDEPESVQPSSGAAAKSPGALWHSLRRFAREHFTGQPSSANDDIMPDYAALIEQDIANMSFNDGEGESLPGEAPRKSGRR